MSFNFVYPNVSEVNRGGRGGLDERFKLARQTDPECQYVEVPADFIKNKREVKDTGLGLCEFLDKEAIEKLYKRTQTEDRLGYVLHTEPSLYRTISDNEKIIAREIVRLKWHDSQWRKKLVKMILNLCEHLDYPASFIEIHPGDRDNSNEDIIKGCQEILESFWEKYSSTPTILLENRTGGQFISTGYEMRSFWRYLKKEHPDLEKHVGIVLDIQQLFTKTGGRFEQELDLIPVESIKGLHIHRKHGPPFLSDGIPWSGVFKRFKAILHRVILNPEVHRMNDVPTTIQFCKNMIQS